MLKPARIAVAGLIFFASTVTAETCHYILVKPGAGRFSAGKLTVDLGQADDAARPRAWQGPITITQSNGVSCTVDPTVGIIEQPIYRDGRHFLVVTYSGSNKIVYAIDAASCHVLWHSQPFTGPVRLNLNKLQMGNQTTKIRSDCIPDSQAH